MTTDSSTHRCPLLCSRCECMCQKVQMAVSLFPAQSRCFPSPGTLGVLPFVFLVCFSFSPILLFLHFLFLWSVQRTPLPACRQARQQTKSLLSTTLLQHRPRRQRPSPCCRWLPSATKSHKRKACRHRHRRLPSQQHPSPRRRPRQRAALRQVRRASPQSRHLPSTVLIPPKAAHVTSSRPHHKRSLWSRRGSGRSTRTCATRAWRRLPGGSFSISTSVCAFLGWKTHQVVMVGYFTWFCAPQTPKQPSTSSTTTSRCLTAASMFAPPSTSLLSSLPHPLVLSVLWLVSLRMC